VLQENASQLQAEKGKTNYMIHFVTGKNIIALTLKPER
jgi:hypothetical protein